MNERIENYKRLQDDMLQTFINKDSDYGDSFGKTFDKYGIVSALTRMSDKLNRLDNLAGTSEMKVDESIEDTLLDLANYAMLTYLKIHKFDEPDPALDTISNKINETQAKGLNKDTEYRPHIGSAEFDRRSIAVNKDGELFMYPGTNEALSLEETEDFKKYMHAEIGLEDLVNNLYTKIAVPGE